MTKFHLSENGPSVCKAKPGNCPITKNTDKKHYSTYKEAEKAFSENLNKLSSFNKIKNIGLPNISFIGKVLPKKNSSYFGMNVDENLLKQHINAWKNLVSEEKALEMESSKINRDGGYHFHLTVIDPIEKRKLSVDNLSNIPSGEITFKGIGKTVKNDKEAWFIVCDSKDLNNWRKSIGLPFKDFHITLGFINNDVHNVDKSEKTLVLI